MILSDVVPLRKTETSRRLAPYKDMEETLSHVLNGLGFLQKLDGVTYEERSHLTSMIKKAQRELDQQVVKIALAHPGVEVPEVIQTRNSIGAKIAQTPQADLSELRNIADLLGFLIIPFEYLHPDAYHRESHGMQVAIRSFTSQIGDWFTPYVVTPPVFYNVEAHANAEVDLPIYSGPLTSQAMMALSMSMPMFRSLLRNLKSLASANRAIQQQLDGVQQEIQGIKTRLTALETYVEREIQMRVQAERERQAEAAQRETRTREERLVQYEPMLIGIPKKQTVNSDCTVLIGPCWGPDFEDIVFTALRLRKVEGQRKALALKASLFT